MVSTDTIRLVRLTRASLTLNTSASGAFFGPLALRLKVEESQGVPTCATDGRSLWVNSEFWGALTAQERIGVLVHEVMHCAMGHQSRRGGREHTQWNVACDCAINHVIHEAGFHLPHGAILPGHPPLKGRYNNPFATFIAGLPMGLSAEAYYDRLSKHLDKQQQKKGGGQPSQEGGESQPQAGQDEGKSQGQEQEDTQGQLQNGKGQGKPQPGQQPGQGRGNGQGGGQVQDPGGCGAVVDAAPDAAGQQQSQDEWHIAAVQAARQARSRGTLPGGLGEWLGAIERPRTRAEDVLREFLERATADDYDWSRPNRRHIGRGMYLPSIGGDALPYGVVLVDSSGSISDELLKRFCGWVQGVLEAHPTRLLILYHDVDVYESTEWSPCDGDLDIPRKMKRGGTSHKPAFQRIEDEPETPRFVVSLTDLYTEYPETAPDCPVLWIVPREHDKEPPFGRVLTIAEE